MGAAAALVLLAGAGWIVATAPALPPDTDAVIDDVLASELPELVTGVTGTVASADVEIWYERMSPAGPPRGAVLLIMGAGGSALFWPAYFYGPLIDAGYEVVRFDNRGIGMSDWLEDWDPEHPYDVEDMALDALAVLDALDIEGAHVVGISMGGMIGQRLAISHAHRIASLTSIASSGYAADPTLLASVGDFERRAIRLGLRYAIVPGTRNRLRMAVGMNQLLKGDGSYDVDVRDVAQTALYEGRNRKGHNFSAAEQHFAAVRASGSRLDELRLIQVPTLVIHGASDPLLPVAHAEIYAPLIPGARLLVIDAMGHDLPRAHTPEMIDAMLKLFERAEGAR